MSVCLSALSDSVEPQGLRSGALASRVGENVAWGDCCFQVPGSKLHLYRPVTYAPAAFKMFLTSWNEHLLVQRLLYPGHRPRAAPVLTFIVQQSRATDDHDVHFAGKETEAE